MRVYIGNTSGNPMTEEQKDEAAADTVAMVERVANESRRDSRVWKTQRKDVIADKKTWFAAFLVHMFPAFNPAEMLKSFDPFHHIELTDGRYIRIWSTKMSGKKLVTRYTIFGGQIDHGNGMMTPDWDSIIR